VTDAPHAIAVELPREAVLPLAMAQDAAVAALGKCLADGYRVSVAVVDRGGNVRALLRGDGAGPHTPDSSFKKAYTSASLGRPTGELAGMVGGNTAVAGLRDMNDKILILGGGLPIRFGQDLVGGIGVGGAPGGQLDEACAKAGLEKIGAGS
jgi:uncharacterized protein GlcG (DUF336 family)